MFDKPGRTNERLALTAMVCLVCVSAVNAGTRLYVDDDAPLNGDGLTWDSAFRYLQDALYTAGPGSGVEEIRIGQGIYKPDQDEGGNVTPGDRHATFQLIAGVELKGGYAGYGAPDPDARDIQLYETILSGDLLGDDLPDEIISDENSYHVVNYTDEGDIPATFDGLTITHGLADGESIDAYGGGVSSSGCLSFRQCILRTNNAQLGAAVYCKTDYQLMMIDCDVNGNHALGRAGGLYVGDDVLLEDCRFADNSSQNGIGGAIWFSRHLSATGCVFNNNSAGSDGGAIGALFGDVDITDCVFTDNEAGHGGGAIGLWMSIENQSTITDCHFSGNQAGSGGAVHSDPFPMYRMVFVGSCQFLDNEANHRGGALDFDKSGFQVVGSEFRDNAAPTGGAVSVWGEFMDRQSFEYCIFEENRAETGGAIDCRDADFVNMPGCSFTGNTSDEGGALFFSYSEIKLTQGSLTDNNAQSGGAIHLADHTDLFATDCLFEANHADADGGAIHAADVNTAAFDRCQFASNTAQNGGAVWVCEVVDDSMTECALVDNHATHFGGGVYFQYAGSPDFTRCWFVANTAGEGGGALCAHGSSHDVVNCLFSDNHADCGGAIYGGFGDEAYTTNCTLTRNTADSAGGAIYNNSGWSTVSNCVMWDNSPGQIVEGDNGYVTVRYCDIQGGWQGDGEHNIDVDPRFMNPPAGNFRLRPASPCIDAGNNTYLPDDITTDLDGNPRFFDDLGVDDTGFGDPPIVDIGSYEVQTSSCPTDVNSDGVTDPTDIALLLEAWGECDDPYDCPEDINFDGTVDIDDVFAVLGAWGPCP